MTIRNILRKIKGKTISYGFFPLINFPNRALQTWSNYIWPINQNWIRWLFTSREDSNFTYDLTERCRINLAVGLSSILQKSPEEISRYFEEIRKDSELLSFVTGLMDQHPDRYRADRKPSVGRRMVWYAVVRATKPKIIVETGVDKGLGSIVLCAALKRNSEEGFDGKHFGTDINPTAGYLLQGEYARFGKILYGDSIESLKRLSQKIDVFINDSDHSAEYEQAEYEQVKDQLTENALVLGDNSHVTPKLAEFSTRANRQFIFLSEEPMNHWYRGAGIGISFPRNYQPNN